MEAVSTAVLKLDELLTQKADFLRGGISVGEVQQLKDELKGAQCFLRDAAEKQGGDVAIRDWISETREVAHVAEDAVEVFIFKVERARSMLVNFAASLKHKYHLTKFNISIKSIRKRLRGIQGLPLNYGIQDPANREGAESPKRSEAQRRLTQWQKDKHVVGMEKEVEVLLEKAILDEREELTISAIVGVGGVGKSTLARIVHNHTALADRFQRRAWAVASKELTPKDVVKELYLQVKCIDTLEWELNYLEKLELPKLQELLYKRLQGKRYFIVLDDVCDNAHWSALTDSLPNEGTGSRLLFTSRAPVDEDCTLYTHTMKCLDSEEASWMLFLNTVSDGKGVEDLEEIGRQIVNKCEGLPLAITLVGGLLTKQKRSKRRWQKVLEDIKSHLNRSNNDTMQAVLELSYQNLPPQLKSCFLCLGFFKEGCAIIIRKLVDVWISEGFIPQEGGTTMEETGMAYVEELVDRNMVQIKATSIDDCIKSCVVHDLVLDLCIRKAEEEMKLEVLNEDCKSESSHRPRHRVLNCSQGRFKDSIYGNKHVRSLIIRGARRYLFTSSFSSYWMSFQLLRVLDFEGCLSMTQLPFSVSALIGLRYLSLRNTGISYIPNWLPRLINLEVLDLRGLVYIELSDILGEMCALRHLYASGFYFKKPPQLSNLKFLQTLSYVNMKDADTDQVTQMSCLRKLGINMSRGSDSEWLLFSLGLMENLVHLKLRYSDSLNLDMLGAMRHVTRLKLSGKIPFLPSKFPPNLSHLSLDSCRLKEDPMPLLQNLPKLSYLKLHCAFEGVEIVISQIGFPVLKVLILHYLWRLENIRVEEGAIPELKILEINQCSWLESSPEEMGGILRNLEELRIVASRKIAAKLRGEDSHIISNVPYVQIIDDSHLD